jgi:hypothetical protein
MRGSRVRVTQAAPLLPTYQKPRNVAIFAWPDGCAASQLEPARILSNGPRLQRGYMLGRVVDATADLARYAPTCPTRSTAAQALKNAEGQANQAATDTGSAHRMRHEFDGNRQSGKGPTAPSLPMTRVQFVCECWASQRALLTRTIRSMPARRFRSQPSGRRPPWPAPRKWWKR